MCGKPSTAFAASSGNNLERHRTAALGRTFSNCAPLPTGRAARRVRWRVEARCRRLNALRTISLSFSGLAPSRGRRAELALERPPEGGFRPVSATRGRPDRDASRRFGTVSSSCSRAGGGSAKRAWKATRARPDARYATIGTPDGPGDVCGDRGGRAALGGLGSMDGVTGKNWRKDWRERLAGPPLNR